MTPSGESAPGRHPYKVGFRLYQVGRPSITQEKDPLTDAPEGSCPELVATGAALRDAVG
jgi:hypothetical protein